MKTQREEHLKTKDLKISKHNWGYAFLLHAKIFRPKQQHLTGFWTELLIIKIRHNVLHG